ncbi:MULTISPECIES: polyprenyl synthetase family protein [Nosocomiicoccus]|uniref:Farnesyl diphosphate synthase n=1 Tax=Nosocomiicoccus massiliensis TaxID=1232430 RepID=A0AAF0YJH6_9STAP|nr:MULTISPECIES: farnesyl diphosphate synthase [Nosocomiicoccus]OFL47046.1 hypothetical protein HMPREF2767_00505 [Nosocomiicoccus sp. HMSC067E10]OFS64206.1 hypothetical protein HMPREF3177_01360 [Nosocomiicoccus sp. HMSC09A07]WOS96495.1 polyprenyl synthetase family protein [Nosocomiicoccus massiliensis]
MINSYQKYLDDVDKHIKHHLSLNDVSDRIKESSLYSISAGGKKIRPLLLFKTLRALNHELSNGVPMAAAIEMVHTYSLIHDDLPAMDNDDYRRGKLTNHKVYGEATAILAGDNLLTESIHLLTLADYSNDVKVKLIETLTSAAGQNGMISGQMNDILSTNASIDYETLEQIHRHKTGKLMVAPVISAAIIANQNEDVIATLQRFAEELGLLFQIKDDLLDVQGTKEEIGKEVGTDEKNNTTTYVSLFGIEGATDLLKKKEKETTELLYRLKDEIDIIHLEDIITIVVNRTK